VGGAQLASWPVGQRDTDELRAPSERKRLNERAHMRAMVVRDASEWPGELVHCCCCGVMERPAGSNRLGTFVFLSSGSLSALSRWLAARDWPELVVGQSSSACPTPLRWSA